MSFPSDPVHPMFWLGMRRRRWWLRGRPPIPYALGIITWTVFVLLAVWFVANVLGYRADDGSSIGSSVVYSYYSYNDEFMGGLFAVTMLVGGFSLFLSYVLDFVLMVVTVGAINGERTAHRWELVQMTPLEGQSIVAALHQTSQYRFWRLTMLLIGTRVAVVVALVLQGVVIFPIAEGGSLFWWTEDFWHDYIWVWVTYMVLLFVYMGAAYMTEPLWRLRSTTAVGLAVSAQVGRLPLAMALAFVVMVGVWIAMLVGFFGLFALLVWLGEIVFSLSYDYQLLENIAFRLLLAAFFALETVVVYGGFKLVRGAALRWTLRHTTAPYRERWQTPPRHSSLPRWNMLRWRMPHSGMWIHDKNPLFALQVRRLRWWRSFDSPRRRYWWVFFITLAAVMLLVFAVIFTLFLIGTERLFSGFLSGRFSNDWAEIMMGGAVLAGLGVLAWLVFSASQTAAAAMREVRQVNSGDALYMTPLTPAQIVEACRTYARGRVWGLTAFVEAYFIALVVGVLLAFTAGWLYRNVGIGWKEWTIEWDYFINDGVMPVVLVSIAALIVPALEVRLVVAGTLALAARFHGWLLSGLRGLLLLVIVVPQVLFGFWFWDMVVYDYTDDLSAVLAAAVLVIALAFALEQGALALARRFVMREGA